MGEKNAIIIIIFNSKDDEIFQYEDGEYWEKCYNNLYYHKSGVLINFFITSIILFLRMLNKSGKTGVKQQSVEAFEL